MGHPNRGRLAVDTQASWSLYQCSPLPGWEILGTVTRGQGDTGALVRHTITGVYAQANAGSIRTLVQRKIEAALRGA